MPALALPLLAVLVTAGASESLRLTKARAALAESGCSGLVELASRTQPSPGLDRRDDAALAAFFCDAAFAQCAAVSREAVALGRAAYELDPDNGRALLITGLAAKESDRAVARERLEKAMKALPTDPRPRIALAEIALFEGDARRALSLVSQLEHLPETKRLREEAQWRLEEKKREDAVVRDLVREARAEGPRVPERGQKPNAEQRALARERAARGKELVRSDPAASARLLSEAMELDPSLTELHLHLAISYVHLKQTSTAADHYEAFLQHHPNRPEARDVRKILADYRKDLARRRVRE